MKKLTFSLMLAMLVSIIGLGWGLDNLFSQYQAQEHSMGDGSIGENPTAESNELTPYYILGSSLAKTLDKQKDINEFIANWQHQNKLCLSLIHLVEFPLPTSLQEDFNSGKPLTLESEDNILIHFILPKNQKVLMLSLPAIEKNTDNSALQLILTTLFYLGIIIVVFIWLYPLIKHLKQLRITAKAFGEGQLQERIVIDSTSYISDIEIEFNNMAQRIETLVNDNKLLGNAVSHDLRTPLARLRFGIEALQETNNQKTREKYEAHISRDIDEMEKLVAVLLNYARLEQAMIAVERKPIELNRLIMECINSIRSGRTEIIFQPKGEATILGDYNYLTMLVNNLLNNAQQYGNHKILICVEQFESKVVFSIADDGSGIAQEKREGLLKPFTRGDNVLEQSGYGMGLAIVFRIALWHKADFTIGDSSELGGAEFSLEFKV